MPNWPSFPPSAWWDQTTAAIAALQASVNKLEKSVSQMAGKVSQILMSEQQILAAVSQVSAALDAVAADQATLVADAQAIQAQLAAGQPVSPAAMQAVNDLVTKAQAVQAGLDSATGQVSGLVTPPA